jgi:hypothetical protein
MQRPSRASWASAIFNALEAFLCESLVACERVVSTVKRVNSSPSRSLGIAGAMVLLASVSTSKAAVIFSDNFDSYANQTAFQTAWPVVGTSTTLDTTTFFSSGQSAQGGTAATRNTHAFTGTTPTASNAVEFSFRFYDSNSAAAAYRQVSEIDNTTSPGASGQLFAMGLNNNISSTFYMARVLGADGGTGSGSFFKLDGTGTPNSGNSALTRTTGWHLLTVDIFSTGTANFYVDGLLARTNIGTFTVRSMDTIRLGSGITSLNTANFDDVVVQTIAVPEPASIGMLAVASLATLCRKRR